MEKPQTYNGDFDKLPPALAHLRDEKIWVCWKWEPNKKGTNWTKPPYRADNPDYNASSSDPNSWGSYDQAVEQVRAGKADGIGFAIKKRNIGDIDLDNCHDPKTKEIKNWATEYLRQFPNAYAEVTVSGKGLRILGTSALESFAPKFKNNGTDIELFSNSNHYLTLSCNEISTCTELPPIDEEMRAIARRLGTRPDWKDGAPEYESDQVDKDRTGDETAQPASETPWSFAEETRLRSALSAIPTDEAVLREKFGHAHITWVNIGRAIERLGWGERGYAIFRDWSAQNAVEFDEKGLQTKWRSFNRNHRTEKPITIATLYYYAMKFGWSGDQSFSDKEAGDLHDTTIIQSSADFVRGFVPPNYVVVGLIQRRFLYSLTGQTGSGKTAVTLRLTASVAQGIKFA